MQVDHSIIAGLVAGLFTGGGTVTVAWFFLKRHFLRVEEVERKAARADANAVKALESVAEVKVILEKKKDIVVCEVIHRELGKTLVQILKTGQETAVAVAEVRERMIRLEERGKANG